MNRQAIAFLTMFSLVLMLAVYYVTMPVKQSNEPSVVVSTPNTYEKMKSDLSNKRNGLLEKYTSIIASSESSSNEKSIAMEQMNVLNKIINDEKIYTDLLNKIGYEDCYLEIEQDVMKITVIKDSFDTSDASKIIKKVLLESNYQYIPEVTFSK